MVKYEILCSFMASLKVMSIGMNSKVSIIEQQKTLRQNSYLSSLPYGSWYTFISGSCSQQIIFRHKIKTLTLKWVKFSYLLHAFIFITSNYKNSLHPVFTRTISRFVTLTLHPHHVGNYSNKLHIMNKWLPVTDITGAVLEIGLRVGVIPSAFHLDTFCWPFFSVFTHKELRNLFKELYLRYFGWNFASFIASCGLKIYNSQFFLKKLFLCRSKGGLATNGPIARMAPVLCLILPCLSLRPSYLWKDMANKIILVILSMVTRNFLIFDQRNKTQIISMERTNF